MSAPTPGERRILDYLLEAMEEELTQEQVNRVLGRLLLVCSIGVPEECREQWQGWQN